MLDVARFAQVQFSLALLALIVLLVALAWRNVFGRPPAPDLVLPRWWRTPKLEEPWRRRGRWALDGGLALTALGLALFSMTAARPMAIDRGVLLHEVVQAKYHGELGWDGLYPCAWAADRDGERSFRGVEKLRVVEPGPAPMLEPIVEAERDEVGVRPRVARPPAPTANGSVIPARVTLTKVGCRERFSDERWAALGADIASIAGMNPEFGLGHQLQGYGPTATPTRLARQRLVFALLPVSATSVFLLALLAGLLTVAALVVVERAYGLRVAAVVGIAVFVEFSASPISGGATPTGTLVIATMLAGFAATELERWGLAGALLGFAAAELVWPAILVLGLFAKLGVDWLGGRSRKRELQRLAIGVGATVAAMLLLGATLPGGFGNWSTWADQVAVNRYADGSRQIGLRWLFAPEGNLMGAPRSVAYPDKAQHLVDRHDWILLSATLLAVPSLLAVRRLPAVAFATIAGVTLTFGLFSTEARAWGVALPLLVLAAGAIGKHHAPSRLLVGRPATILAAGVLALSVGMHGIVRIHQTEAFLFNSVYSHLLTTLLIGLGVALVVLPGLREHGDPPGAPPAIPVLDEATKLAPKFPWIAKLRGRAQAPARSSESEGGRS